MEVTNAADVVNEDVFKHIMQFIVDNYTDSGEDLVEAYMALVVIQAILKDKLGMADMEIVLGEEEDERV